MHVGILTYHHSDNYGTELQALALEKYLNEVLGVNGELIDFRPTNSYHGRKLFITRVKRLFYYLIHIDKILTIFINSQSLSDRSQRIISFSDKELHLSAKPCCSIDELSDACIEFDTVLVGSDQTWNPNVSQWKAFLLDYLDTPNIRKIAYGPSLGTGAVPPEFEELYKEALKGFSYVSCRDVSGAVFLSRLLGKPVPVVLDPTLLFDWEWWSRFSRPICQNKPYVLTYFLGDNKNHRNVVREIARRNNYEIIAIPMSFREMKDKGITKKYCGPGEFLSLIKNAALVCTDSFHGTIFSINFNTNFISFPKRKDKDKDSDNQRLYDILSLFSLSDRLYDMTSVPSVQTDFSVANKTLETMRIESGLYLKKAIGE